MIKIKVVDGHLTAGDKAAIKAIMAAGMLSAKVGKAVFEIQKTNNLYTVTKKVIDRGIIPVAGSQLRLSIYKSTFTTN